MVFCTANVLIDLEPLYYMQFDQGSLHRFFHTHVGASLIAAATTLVFVPALKLATRTRLPDPFQWQALKPDADRKFNRMRASITRVLGFRKPLDCLV